MSWLTGPVLRGEAGTTTGAARAAASLCRAASCSSRVHAPTTTLAPRPLTSVRNTLPAFFSGTVSVRKATYFSSGVEREPVFGLLTVAQATGLRCTTGTLGASGAWVPAVRGGRTGSNVCHGTTMEWRCLGSATEESGRLYDSNRLCLVSVFCLVSS